MEKIHNMEDLAPIFPFIGTGLAVFTCCLIWGKLNRKWAKSFGYLLTVVVFSLSTMATYFMRLMYPELGTDNMAWFIPWGVGIWGLIAILNIIDAHRAQCGRAWHTAQERMHLVVCTHISRYTTHGI